MKAKDLAPRIDIPKSYATPLNFVICKVGGGVEAKVEKAVELLIISELIS